MSNFTVTTTYQTLATIMGASYDATKDFSVHVNEIALGLLQVSDSNTTKGKEYPSFADFVIEKGTTVYLKGSISNIDIYITEKA